MAPACGDTFTDKAQEWLFMAVYNVFFHPLRKYPGSWIMAMSQLPIIYAKITGVFPYWAIDLHEKYGHVGRTAPNELSYSDANSWKDIYASHPDRPSGMARDTSFFSSLDEPGTIPSMFNANDKDHSRIRRTYARAFSKQAIAQQSSLIHQHIRHMMDKLYEQRHHPIDLVHMFTFAMTDIMIDMQFGEPLGLLESTTHHSWARSQAGLLRNSTILAALGDLPVMRLLFQLILPQLVRRARATHYGWMNKKLDDRLAMKTTRPDIVHFVMEKAGPEATISEAELRVNLPLIMIAQTESTATVLSGVVAFLLDNPRVLRELQDEVRAHFKTSEEINVPATEKMPILNACINETLRLYQGAPGELPREVPKGGAMVSGEWVPGGTRVYNSSVACFRSPRNFHDATSWRPERWYSNASEEFSNDDKEAWKPFGTGTRDCIGRQ
ncbi:cytochrome P450 [Penicillium capsulatum]|uniref:Cytochrome P450 n=1 Tax=Penicillium capsulatum TaxID=69766 RepID=A0A9W9LSG1_9EURO|nr:cytochrome P450 [Penicillium capsulatum]